MTIQNEEKYVEEKVEEIISYVFSNERKQEKIWLRDYFKIFIRTIVNDCKPKELARMTKYPGTKREEEWIRIK